MPPSRIYLLALALLLLPAVGQATECPNCVLEFPSSWTSEQHFWGTRIWIDRQAVDVKVQRDDVMHPLGPGDEADEQAWLEAEAEAEGVVIEQTNARIVRTVSREPAIVLGYTWSDAEGSHGRGVRLVRRCGVRLIFEHRGGEQRLDALLQVSDRVRYTRAECTKHNADVIPIEVLEGVDQLRLPDVSTAAPEATPSAGAEGPRASSVPSTAMPRVPDPREGGDQDSFSGLLVGLGATLVGLLVLIGVMLRTGGKEPLDGLPPLREEAGQRAREPGPETSRQPRTERPRASNRETPDGSSAEKPRDEGATVSHVLRTGARPPPPGTDPDDPERPSSDDFGDENTDAILPAGTYGLRGAGGGDTSERIMVDREADIDARGADPEPGLGSVPPATPISVPSHAVVSYSSAYGDSTSPHAAGNGDEESVSFDENDVIRVSPVESALASLGISTWLDFTAPAVKGMSFLPSTIASLVEVQNGGRFGYGWLLLLGLRRKNMDLMTLNGEARVKERFGEGWLVGVFAFGNVLWVDEGQRWEIRTTEGERIYLGDSAESALRRLAEDEALRDRGAQRDLVERCRSAVGELLPGWVYLHRGESGGKATPEAGDGRTFEPVEIVPFLELLSR